MQSLVLYESSGSELCQIWTAGTDIELAVIVTRKIWVFVWRAPEKLGPGLWLSHAFPNLGL